MYELNDGFYYEFFTSVDDYDTRVLSLFDATFALCDMEPKSPSFDLMLHFFSSDPKAREWYRTQVLIDIFSYCWKTANESVLYDNEYAPQISIYLFVLGIILEKRSSTKEGFDAYFLSGARLLHSTIKNGFLYVKFTLSSED
ncbi:MAG: hypothetical protein ROR55_09515 [Devosia sp.]